MCKSLSWYMRGKRRLCCNKSYTYVQLRTNLYRKCFYILPSDTSYVYYVLKDLLVIITTHFSAKIPVNVCSPSPCGPNSQCRNVNEQAVCSCIVGYLGTPPNCRPECVQSSECPLTQACNNQKCIDPCLGACGIGAICHVINHNPVCSCQERFTGDPFTRCQPQGININYINSPTLGLLTTLKRNDLMRFS